MVDAILTYSLIILSTFSTTLLAAVLIQNRGRTQRSARQLSEEEEPELDPEIEEAERRSQAIFRQAVKKAKQVVAKAELEGMALIAKFRTIEEKAEGDYTAQLNAIVNETKEKLGRDATAAEATYEQFLKSLSEKINREVLTKEEDVRQKIDGFFQKIAESLEGYTEDLKKRAERVAMPVESIRQSLEAKLLGAAGEHSIFLTNLEKNLASTQERVEGQTATAQKNYENYLNSLQESLKSAVAEKEETLNRNIEAFFNRSEALLQNFLNELQNRTETQLDKEIGNAKRLVDEYRRTRMAVIDENIVAVLEKTLNIALGKKLTLGEQTQLIYEALEQAKKENFFS